MSKRRIKRQNDEYSIEKKENHHKGGRQNEKNHTQDDEAIQSQVDHDSPKSADLLKSFLHKIPHKSKTIEELSTKSKQAILLQELSLKQHLCRPMMIYVILIFMILCNALWVVHQTYYYRLDYSNFDKLKDKSEKLEMERSKMLIEKQTFGTSGQIATYAMMTMGMFSPSSQQRVVIQISPNDAENNDE